MKVAISGGIGSGKSAVTRILRELGAKVVVADEVNASLLTEKDYIEKIKNRFPAVVHNNVINKKELAAIIYRDEGERRALMEIAHPIIFRRMLSLYPDEALVFYEIPLLSESPIRFDRIWYVDAPLSDRVKRISIRDEVDREYAERIISLQVGEDRFLSIADAVINNHGDLDALKECVKREYYSILGLFS